MRAPEEIAREFIAEQSRGEWGDSLEAQDAARLASVVSAAQAEAYQEGRAGYIERLYTNACVEFAKECRERLNEIEAVKNESKWYKLANAIRSCYPEKVEALENMAPHFAATGFALGIE